MTLFVSSEWQLLKLVKKNVSLERSIQSEMNEYA